MLSTDDTQRSQEKDEKQLGVSDGSFEHVDDDTDMEEFSRLLARVPTDVLWNNLMTHQQRLMATAAWQAANWGGKTPPPGEKADPKRQYAEWVLRIDHDRQWEEARKKGKL